MQTVEQAFATAVDHHRHGHLDDARQVYELILGVAPDHPAALNNLGLILSREEAVPLFRRALATAPDYVDAWVNLSSALQAGGDPAGADDALGHALALIPPQPEPLFHLAHVLQTQGREAEAAVQYERVLALQPGFAAASCNLGIIHTRAERQAEAAACYRRALASDPGLLVANLNMVSILESEGRLAEARRYRRHIPRPQALVTEPAPEHRRTVLVLANTCVGNIPLDTILPRRTNTRITWHVEFATDAQADALPPFDVAFNAIGNADVLDESSAQVERFARRHRLLNHPDAVARTRRDRLPELLAGIPGVVTPEVLRLAREAASGPVLAQAMAAAGIDCPVLLRPIAGHGGEGTRLLRTEAELAAWEPGEADAYYVIAYHESRRADGFYRKYRVVFVDGRPFPYHLAISDHWLVHYFSAAMLSAPWKREEERCFLENPVAVLGVTASAALEEIGRRLQLDFAGIDFTLLPDGQLLVFEANATMLVHLRDSAADFPYKHAHVPAIFTAMEAMLDRHASIRSEAGQVFGEGLACPPPLP